MTEPEANSDTDWKKIKEYKAINFRYKDKTTDITFPSDATKVFFEYIDMPEQNTRQGIIYFHNERNEAAKKTFSIETLLKIEEAYKAHLSENA